MRVPTVPFNLRPTVRALLLSGLLGTTTLMLACQSATPHAPVAASAPVNERTLILQYNADGGDAAARRVAEAATTYGARVRNQLTAVHMVVVEIPPSVTPDAAIDHFQQLPDVIAVSRDEVMELHTP